MEGKKGDFGRMNVYCVFNTTEINNEQVALLQAIFHRVNDAINYIRENPQLDLHWETWNVK